MPCPAPQGRDDIAQGVSPGAGGATSGSDSSPAAGRKIMAQTLTNLLFHVVFSTKDRLPLIDAELKPDLLAYIGGIVRELGGKLLAANGTADHVHLLLRLPPRLALADTVRVVKTNSSRWVQEPRFASPIPVAGGIRHLQCQPIQRARGRALHPKSGTASPAGFIPGRIASLLEKARNRI